MVIANGHFIVTICDGDVSKHVENVYIGIEWEISYSVISKEKRMQIREVEEVYIYF